jgi:protein TonB
MPARHLPGLALAAVLVACSKGEPPPAPKPQPPAPKAVAPVPAAPDKPAEIDDKLKERLARQEAAAKMFESKVLQPPAPKVPEPPPPAVRAATPPPAAAAPASAPPAPRVEPTRSEPPKVEPPKVATRSEPPKAASPQPAPPAAPKPRTDLAAAKPSAAPEAQGPRLITRVDPDFPREAVVAGVDQGNVRARMTLDASGNVTRVEVLDANPRRVFDRAVVRALSQWRYSDGAAGRTVDMEIAFRR